MSVGNLVFSLASENELCNLIPPDIVESMELIGDDWRECRDTAGFLKLTISLGKMLLRQIGVHSQLKSFQRGCM